MIETRPLRQTTTALVERATQDYSAALQRIANMAVIDGEVPNGSNLNTIVSPPRWEITTPDIQPPEAPHE